MKTTAGSLAIVALCYAFAAHNDSVADFRAKTEHVARQQAIKDVRDMDCGRSPIYLTEVTQ